MGKGIIGIGHYERLCGKVFDTVQLANKRFCTVGALRFPGLWWIQLFRKTVADAEK